MKIIFFTICGLLPVISIAQKKTSFDDIKNNVINNLQNDYNRYKTWH
jgi:endonuclease V-like protein UPF0215 family